MVKQRYKFPKYLILLAAVFLTQACAHHFAVPRETPLKVYAVDARADSALQRWTPLFAAHGFDEPYNRIGEPAAHTTGGRNRSVRIEIDPERPVVYAMERSFTTARGAYLNLIYRVHFPRIPYSLIPFNLSAGRNSGLLVVITLNQHQQPVLVTTVHTCGCYSAIVPTNFLSRNAYPGDWQDEPLSVYGEKLPSRLDFAVNAASGLLVHLRPEVHRVMNLEVVSTRHLDDRRFAAVPMEMADMADLNRLPSPDGPVSFYYQNGAMKGHVKGAFKPLETLLLGLFSLDFYVGTDKIYGDPQQWDNPFYTSLKPWQRHASDMWDFNGFLNYWGWQL
jgi:hypothetical protein